MPMEPRSSGRALMRRTMSSVTWVSGRVFHVDAEEVAGGVRMLREARSDGFGEGGIECEAHLGELDADVGVEFARSDLIEKLVVDVGGLVSLFCSGDAFAERVERDMHALLVDLGADAKGVFDFKAGDETRAQLAADGGVLGKFAESAIVGERNKRGTEYGHQLTLPGDDPGKKVFALDSPVSHSRAAVRSRDAKRCGMYSHNLKRLRMVGGRACF